MARDRRKTRKQIIEQAKRIAKLSKGNNERIARVNSIRDRYVANIDKQTPIQKRLQRNEYLRSLIGTSPMRNDVQQSYYEQGVTKNNRKYMFKNDHKMSDASLRGLIGMNSAFINNKKFNQANYMQGSIKGLTQG